MRLEVLLPLALLFIAQGVPSIAQNAAEESHVAVEEGAPLTVECSLRVEQSVEWRLDGGAPPADLRPAGEAAAAAGRLAARLQAAAARAQHAGVYTCARPPAQRVRVSVRPAPLRARAVPAETTTAAATTTTAATSTAPPVTNDTVFYDVGRPFTLNCSIAGAGFVWTVNKTALAEVPALKDRHVLEKDGAVLRISGRSQEDDFGTYACSAGGNEQTWDVRGSPHAKLPPNTNVVEGQKLKLVCKVIGKPYSAVSWTYRNSTDVNATDVAEALAGRATLQSGEQGVAGAVLVLDAAQSTDAGFYSCAPAAGVADTTTLRVKDMYAALWPFLGICAEVFVLCAIILVYEKRRTKPELDDSDTDNHDQKKS